MRGSVFAETGKGPRRRLGVILAGAVFVLAVVMDYFLVGGVLERVYMRSMWGYAGFDAV